jgi:UDP-N-acetylmuramate dehydrogenase
MLVRRNVDLKNLTSFKIGGAADYFCEADSIDEIKGALKLAEHNKVPFFVFGGGTNILVDDPGFRGVIIKPKFNFIEKSSCGVRVGAGILMNDLLGFCSRNGLSGLEWAGGLPGTIGGAIRGNAGAFGGEIKDVIEEVISFDTVERKVIRRNNKKCCFAYRSSIFKSSAGREIILEALLRLEKGNGDVIAKAIEEKINYRNLRYPLEYPSAGSVFKNINVQLVPRTTVELAKTKIKFDPFPVIPAAYLIAEAGLKGRKVGEAMVSAKHPNFIVNLGKATAADVRNLIKIVKHEVAQRFKVELEEEILISKCKNRVINSLHLL